MFESALFESTAAIRPQTRWPAIASFTAQALIVACLLALPLLHPALLAPRQFTIALAPPPPPPPVHPPTPRVHVVATETTAPPAPAPTHAPILTRPTQPIPEAPPAFSTLTLTGSAVDTPALPLGLGTPSTHPSIAVTPSSPHSNAGASATHAISTGVSAGLLLEPIHPIYPAIARAAHQQGTVLVAATISTTGRVESAHAISGPVMLQAAAVDAVRTARYRPFLLNNQPTEVEATFIIHFNLTD